MTASSANAQTDTQKAAETAQDSEMAAAINASQAVIEFTPDGKIVTANENFLAVMGYALDEIEGCHHKMFVAEDFAESPDYRAFWKRLKSGEFVSDKFHRVAKGGKDVWLQASYNPIVDDKGKVVRVVKFATDITEQETAARQALFKSSAFEGAAMAMMMVNRDLVVIDANEATRDLLTANRDAFQEIWPDFDPDEIVGACIDMFHKKPEHQRRLLSDPSRLPFRTDITIGDMKFALNVSAVYDAKRNYVGNILQWDDVTAARVNAGMLDALQRSQAVIEFSLDGTILKANENFLNTVGYSLDEIVGKRHSMFVEESYGASAEYREFWARLNAGEFISEKFRRFGKGGKEIWIQASYNPILDGNGKPFKVVKFASDVTDIEHERERAEQERAAKAAEQSAVVNALADALQSLSEGDLTARISDEFPGEYERLRADFNAALDRLQDTMKSVLAGADGISTGANEISQAADDLSQRTERQAASLEETAAALEQITATVKMTAQNAQSASQIVGKARNSAEEGGRVVDRAVDAMNQIENSSRQITEIIGVIDKIAFQTNLLALNAGVEAARAGDAGRGFAVVASEVRALAQRSSEAAKEIETLIKASSGQVESGVRLVGETGSSLKSIVEQVIEINTLVTEVAQAAQQQSAGIDEVNTAVGEMDQVTQQNAAMVEQATAASRSLANETEELSRLVSFFKAEEDAPSHDHRGDRHREPIRAAQPRAQASPPPGRFSSGRTNGAFAMKAAPAPQEDDWQEF